MPKLKIDKVEKLAVGEPISAMICSKPGGDPLPHYEMVEGRQCGKPRYILVKAGDRICPRIHIPAKFDWKGNNALRLELFYNAKETEPLIGLPIPRRSQDRAIHIDVDKWPIWHKDSKTWRDATFEFRILQKNLKGEQNEYTNGGHALLKEPLGQIRIALTRMRILEYHNGMELPDLGDQKMFRTMSGTADPILIKSVDLNIGISSIEETLIGGRTPFKFKIGSVNHGHRINLRFYFRRKKMIDHPMDVYKGKSGHLRVKLQAVRQEDRVSLGSPVRFSEYFEEATAIDPLKLFPEEARPSADELEQEQVLQENMGDRDTYSGSTYHAGFSVGEVFSLSRSSARTGTSSTVETPNEIGEVQFGSLDDEVEHLYTLPMVSSSSNATIKSEDDQQGTSAVGDVSISSLRPLKRAAAWDSNDGNKSAKVQKLLDEEAEIEMQLELLQDRNSDTGEPKVKLEEDTSS
ncbi:hypothetical protein MMC17_000093 [Xylographa soralifera]|nr:hypothetical protein [Xylographa soralifera]